MSEFTSFRSRMDPTNKPMIPHCKYEIISGGFVFFGGTRAQIILSSADNRQIFTDQQEDEMTMPYDSPSSSNSGGIEAFGVCRSGRTSVPETVADEETDGQHSDRDCCGSSSLAPAQRPKLSIELAVAIEHAGRRESSNKDSRESLNGRRESIESIFMQSWLGKESPREGDEVGGVEKRKLSKRPRAKRRGKAIQVSDDSSTEDDHSTDGLDTEADDVRAPPRRRRRPMLPETVVQQTPNENLDGATGETQGNISKISPAVETGGCSTSVNAKRKSKGGDGTPKSQSSASTVGGAPKAKVRRVVMFTGCEVKEPHKSAIRKLGWKLVESWTPEVSYIVAEAVKRTAKFLAGVCSGKPIVTPAFIVECGKRNESIDPSTFLLKDTAGEAKFNFCLRSAISKARDGASIFAGRKVCVCSSITRPPREELVTILKAAGAEALFGHPKGRKLTADLIVFGDSDDAKEIRPHPVYPIELLLDACLKQSFDPSELDNL
eukprot:GHVN01020193.1.p1 GENE.GHVN01020193.1~~GHVN01020193.1.p1  ORF type:complete len:492 (-),score=58.71 GHVN01020193.1:187-1662(-)